MRILVTGATGFLGSHLVPKLVEGGHEVRAIARSSPGAWLAKTQFFRFSLEDRSAVRRALEGVEVVYHLAGLVSFDPKDGRKMYELHVNRTRELLEEALAADVQRFVLASTSGTIAVSKKERIATEKDDYPIDLVGRWPYYVSKIFQERLTLEFCRKHMLPVVVLNPSLLLGPGDDRLSSTWIVSKFLYRKLPTMPNGGMSLADVRDVAEAFVAALTRGEVYGRHLMGVNMSLREFYQRLSRMTGIPAPIRMPGAVNVLGANLLGMWADRHGRTPALPPQEVEMGEHFFYFDSSKAERELGFRARDPHETLYDTVEYLLAQMPPDSRPGVRGELWKKRQRT